MLLDANDCVLALIDYQARLMPAMFEGDKVLAYAARLAQAAKMLNVPRVGTEQNPDKLGQIDPALRALCDSVAAKMSFSAAEEVMSAVSALTQQQAPAREPQRGSARSVPAHLRKQAAPQEPERTTIVLAGCETHVCLLQTALDIVATEEFAVYVVTDACSSRTEKNRDAAFDRLAGAGVDLVTTEMVLFEWLRTAAHPKFKDVQQLIK